MFRLLKEFKQFAKHGSMIDISIGMVIGAAFSKLIYSLVNDIVMPPIGLLLGNVNFNNLFINLSDRYFESVEDAEKAGAPTVNYGMFLNALIHFFIIVVIVFFVVRQVNRMRAPKADPIASMAKKQCPYCYSDIPFQATKCPHCTSSLMKPAVRKKTNKKSESKIKIRVG